MKVRYILASFVIPLQFFTYAQMKLPYTEDKSLDNWQNASGSGTYRSADVGKAQFDFSFSGLAPNSLYQLQCFRLTVNASGFDKKVCDALDWSTFTFRSDAKGEGTIGRRLETPLQDSSKETVTSFALLYQGKDVHLLSIIPARESVQETTTKSRPAAFWIIFTSIVILVVGAIFRLQNSL